MQRIKSLDETIFWWVNGHHSTLLDWMLWCFSQAWCWAVVLLAAYLFLTVKHDRRNWLWVLVGIGVCFLLADQISNNAIKEGVQRLRPCHELEGVRIFHTGKGGMYGFVSSHAANAFAVAMFISLLYGRKRTRNGGGSESASEEGKKPLRSVWVTVLMFAWALVVGYSRPYLGKHYPGDVVCGALLGIGIGAAVYFVMSRIRRRIPTRSSE